MTTYGGALANPGLPYGTYTVCVDDGTNRDIISNVANTNYAAGTTLTVNDYSGGGTGTFTANKVCT